MVRGGLACLLEGALPLTLSPIEYRVRSVDGMLIFLNRSVAGGGRGGLLPTPGMCTVGETKSTAAATRAGSFERNEQGGVAA